MCHSIRLFPWTVALLAVLISALPASAEESPLWVRSGTWEIRVDPTLNHSCFAINYYRTGLALRVGFNKKQDNYYLLLAHNDWASIEEGKEYDVKIRMDRARPWNAKLTGIWMGDMPGLMGSSTDIKFIKEFVRKRSMRIYFQGRQRDHVSLKGSSRAFNHTIDCQRKIDATMGGSAGGGGGDPFSKKTGGGGGGKKDPFAN